MTTVILLFALSGVCPCDDCKCGVACPCDSVVFAAAQDCAGGVCRVPSNKAAVVEHNHRAKPARAFRLFGRRLFRGGCRGC